MKIFTEEYPQSATRTRMLRAAISCFAQKSYDRAGLREIAAEAGVDVAYLHRSFGSKERLFAEALRQAIEDEGIIIPAEPGEDVDAAAVATFMVEEILSRGEPTAPPAAIGIIVHSLGSPTALPLLRRTVDEVFAMPLTTLLGREFETRVALVTALVMGMAIGRSVMRIEALADLHTDEMRQALSGMINEAFKA